LDNGRDSAIVSRFTFQEIHMTVEDIDARNQRFVTAVLVRAVRDIGGVTLARNGGDGHCMICGEKAWPPHWHTDAEIQAGARRADREWVEFHGLPVTADMGS
jgi:hypothetical protein